MTPLNMILTIIIAMLMAVGSWGLGNREKPRNPQGSESKRKSNSESVPLVSEAAMNKVEQAKGLSSLTFPTLDKINGRLDGLKDSNEKLKQLTVDDFKDDASYQTLRKNLMPAPEELKILKTDFAVEEIAKDQLPGLLMPNPDVDPSFDVKVGNNSVEFVRLEVEKENCWFSKEEMGDPPGEKKLLLAGTGASAVYWLVACKSPTKQQWDAAFKVGKPSFNNLEDKLGEHLDGGNVIGESAKAQGDIFKKAMKIPDRMNALRGMLAKKDNSVPNITIEQIKERAMAMAKAGGGTGMAYLKFQPEAKEALKSEARKNRNQNADASANEEYAYRWVIPYPLP